MQNVRLIALRQEARDCQNWDTADSIRRRLMQDGFRLDDKTNKWYHGSSNSGMIPSFIEARQQALDVWLQPEANGLGVQIDMQEDVRKAVLVECRNEKVTVHTLLTTKFQETFKAIGKVCTAGLKASRVHITMEEYKNPAVLSMNLWVQNISKAVQVRVEIDSEARERILKDCHVAAVNPFHMLDNHFKRILAAVNRAREVTGNNLDIFTITLPMYLEPVVHLARFIIDMNLCEDYKDSPEVELSVNLWLEKASRSTRTVEIDSEVKTFVVQQSKNSGRAPYRVLADMFDEKFLLCMPEGLRIVMPAAEKVEAVNEEPKKPSNAYWQFISENRAALIAEVGSAGAAVGKLAGQKWREMSATEKKPYQDQAAALKEQYNARMKAFKEAGGVPRERRQKGEGSQKTKGAKGTSRVAKKDARAVKKAGK